MLIGINASSAFKERPTGVEEYTFQLIKHLAMIPESAEHRFILYLNSRLKSKRILDMDDLPGNFLIKFLAAPFLWTQARLAAEMAIIKIDVLFIPVHILPFIHPQKTVVTLHGLEYEYSPQMYPFFHRKYLRWSTQYALKKATNIIAVSENTKQDLVKLYSGDPNKISVVYHGINQVPAIKYQVSGVKNDNCILYIGRLELKKNILGIIEAYNRLRTPQPALKNKLVLAGSKGFGFEKIKKAINASPFKQDIILKEYISEEKKSDLLKNAAIFLYPSFYEGFGMPVLEAQSAGAPVITSDVSSLPEVAGKGAVFVNPDNIWEIAQAISKILSGKNLQNNLIKSGFENVKRFSWEKCARETLKVLIS